MWSPSPIPEVSWESELKEVNDTWKGTIACLVVAVLFVMTIGIIYWQVVEQPTKHWILKGRFSGLFWEQMNHSLVIQTLTEEKTFVEIDVGNLRNPDLQVPFARNLCWLNDTDFCYIWDSKFDVRISLETANASQTDCYSMIWTPMHCHVDVKHCFSMANVSWYGGASVHAQKWPINNMDIPIQPFTVSDLRDNPLGYGSVLEHYLLGSSGVAVLLSPEVPLHVGMDRHRQLCVQAQPGMGKQPLQYKVCVGRNLKVVHQDMGRQRYLNTPVLPKMDILRSPLWKLLVSVDSGAKVERELRTFSNRLKRHHLGEGVIGLDEHSTSLLLDMDHGHLPWRKRISKRQSRNHSSVKHLNISVTFSPFIGVDTKQFQVSLQDGTEAFWISLPSEPHKRLVPLMTQWKGEICVKLNVSNPAAVSWFLNRVGSASASLDVEYVILEGGEGRLFEGQSMRLPRAVGGDEYIRLLAGVATRIGDTAILTSGTRSSDIPSFILMSPLQGDWSSSGIKGIIPSILHYSILGYNFFIPEAVGGSLTNELVTDEELFIRWLEIVSFLPVVSFQTPPWLFNKGPVLNLTRSYLSKHHDFVIPVVLKYAHEWRITRSPIYRPLWWVTPDDPITFTIDDEFLIGAEVLVAPVTERGALQRNIYLPGSDFQWLDSSNGRVFDGGTLLEDYPVGLDEVAVFTRINS